MTFQNPVQAVSSVRIIVVEDEEEYRKVIVDYLTLAGYNVTAVGTAFDFYKQIEKSFDVAFLDVGLPDQSGLVIAEYLRKNTDTRIVMLTGFATLDDKLAGYVAGADFYLVKPFNFCEITAVIKNLLSRNKELAVQPIHSAAQKPSEHASGPLLWILHSTQWELVTPQKESIKLTSKEFDFLMLLVVEHKKVVQRSSLLKNLGYINNESGHSSLESLVRRLRLKIDALSIPSPIHTSNGNGYGFFAHIVVV